MNEKSWSDCGTACLRIVIVPQFVTRTSIGRMKSFSDELNEFEERLLTKPRPKLTHVPESNTPAAVRSIEASPNVSARSEPPETGSATVVVLTAPTATPASGMTGPQHGTVEDASHGPVAVQRDRPSVAWLPPEKPKSTSMSPGVRTTVIPFAVSVLDWLNSKSMFAVPSVSERTHARWRRSREESAELTRSW